MGRLRCDVSSGPMAAEHTRILRGMLERRDTRPELGPDDRLEGSYHPRAIAISIENWRHRMAHEHRSAQTFANLLPLLVEAEAPLDYKTVALRAAIDELRHAALCGQVVALLGDDPAVDVDLAAEPPTRHPGVPPREEALRNLLFVGCISETIAVGLLTEERDLATEPFVRRALTQLLSDETLHARIGWAYLREVLPTLDADAVERTREYAGRALAHYERCVIGATVPGSFDDDVLRDAARLGFSEPRNAREVAFRTVEEVVVPELAAAGLDVAPWWTDRCRTT